jgi:hypothetical protein
MASNAVVRSACVFHALHPHRLSPISQVTRHCYAVTYNNGGCSAFHTYIRGDCLTAVSNSGWSVCLQTLSRLLFDSQLRFSRYSFPTDPTENSAPLLMWVMYHMFHCSNTVCLASGPTSRSSPVITWHHCKLRHDPLLCVRATMLTWPGSHGNVFTELLPLNGCLYWLNHSGFQQTCNNIFVKIFSSYLSVHAIMTEAWSYKLMNRLLRQDLKRGI